MSFILDPALERDTIPVAILSLSLLRLHRDANYPWLILVPAQDGLVELTDLSDAALSTLMSEIRQCSDVLKSMFHPDKLNVAALGNQVRQLHVHLIARKIGDPAWPNPVWGAVAPRAYDGDALAALAATIAGTLMSPKINEAFTTTL
jgi:diadenosine tetraphosphate (Ap4A) HIT family hydrolase